MLSSICWYSQCHRNKPRDLFSSREQRADYKVTCILQSIYAKYNYIFMDIYAQRSAKHKSDDCLGGDILGDFNFVSF